MGVVKLPNKDDYWSPDPLLPTHPMITSRDRFRYIWRHLDFDSLNESDDPEVWFRKVQPFINHTRQISMKILQKPGLSIALHEMMVSFQGISYETFRIRPLITDRNQSHAQSI